MKNDLIKRQDVIDALELGLENDYVDATELLAYVKQLSSAEPERKKGHWLSHPGDEDWDVCSVCGTGCKRREHSNDGWVTEYNYPFCPNCGARLEWE